MPYVSVNSYGYVKTVSSPNHFFLGKIDLAVNQFFMLLTKFKPSWTGGKDMNGHKN